MKPLHHTFASAVLTGALAWALAGSAVAQQPPASTPPAQDIVKLRQDVMAVERAFAKTMADRDLAAFTRYLSAETVWSGGQGPLVGPDAVVAAWKKYFDGPTPPFSWEPDSVEVMATGQLAISTGPVRDPTGKVFARFHSAWRQEAPGVWRIVLDMGTTHCDCPRP